jgi:hypothetical protein
MRSALHEISEDPAEKPGRTNSYLPYSTLPFMTGEDFEANTPFCQIVHRINQMTQVAAESIEFPDHQSIAPAKGF